MELVSIKKRHYLGFWTEFQNLDLSKIFRKRDKDWLASRDYCVYVWKKNESILYIGKGKFNIDYWEDARPFIHILDMLANTIDPSWTCSILAWGLTNKESRILEAYLIKTASFKRKLSKKGVYKWDGESLINKRIERTYKGIKFEQLYEEYLNLDNGNYYWETFRRQVYNN